MSVIATAGTANNPGSNRRPPKHRTLAQKWRAVSINNKLIVVFSGITMLATVVYSVVAGWTLTEIHTGAADTHALAEAGKKQADAMYQYLVGSEAAVIQPVTTEWSNASLSISLNNTGRVISPNAILKFKAQRYAFPSMKPIGEPQNYTELIPQIPVNGGWGKQFPIALPYGEFAYQKETITLEGTINWDNGFGTRTDQPFCRTYIGHFTSTVPNGTSVGGPGFTECGSFMSQVRYIWDHPLPAAAK